MNKLASSRDIAVVGAGISGISVARILQDRGCSLALYEGDQDVGGLVRCSIEQGVLYHRVGGHVFNSKDPKVLEWFWKHFDRDSEFVQAKRNAAVYLGGRFIPYPIELNLKYLDPECARDIVVDLISLSAKRASDGGNPAHSLGDFLVTNFGKTLADLYFTPYNRKIWKRDLRHISLDWLDGKMPMMRPEEIILANIQGSSDAMVHSSFFYPVNGGSQFIVDRLAAGLEIYTENIQSVDMGVSGYHVNGDINSGFAAIVYTGDIRSLPVVLSNHILGVAGISTEEADRIAQLQSNGTTTLLCECDANDYSWIYLPDPSLKLHRIIMTGNFSRANSPCDLDGSRTTCTIEYSGFLPQDEMWMEAEKLPFNMRPISYHYCPASYVVHEDDTANSVSIFADKLESIGIFLCGRFAQWQYFNMDAAIASAMRVSEKVFTYRRGQ